MTCIREDAQGRIWLATDSGLNVLEDNKITDAGLAGKSLLNITFDQQGHLWAGCWRAVSSGGGLFRFNGRDWETFSTRQNLPGLEILKVFTDSQGQIWVGTYDQGIGAGVGCFDGSDWLTYTQKDGLVENLVRSIIETRDGCLWFGTYPYTRGAGGISKSSSPAGKSLIDRLLNFLPEPPAPKELPSGDEL